MHLHPQIYQHSREQGKGGLIKSSNFLTLSDWVTVSRSFSKAAILATHLPKQTVTFKLYAEGSPSASISGKPMARMRFLASASVSARFTSASSPAHFMMMKRVCIIYTVDV